jgi:anti-anti-sigma factor
MRSLSVEHLKIDIENVNDVVEIRWIGELAVRNPKDAVGDYLEKLQGTLRKQKVCVDFSGFEYMNSASVTVVMQFLRSTSEVAQGVQVKYRPAVQWQKTFFGAMRVIAKNWNNIDIQGVEN